MENKEKIRVIILAAGKGKRMKSHLPKALVLFKDKPFIEHILDTIKKLDPKIKPVIVVGHKKENIIEVLGQNYIYAEQKEQLGTGHAVLSAQNNLRDKHEIVIVISVDQPLVSPLTLSRLIAAHLEKKGVMTLGTVRVTDFEEWREGLNEFGRIVRKSDGSVEKIIEFKDANEEEKKIKELNPAFYAFDAKWLWENISKIKNDNAQAEYYLTDLVKIAHDQNRKIETMEIENILEAFQPNSKEELEILEKLLA